MLWPLDSKYFRNLSRISAEFMAVCGRTSFGDRLKWLKCLTERDFHPNRRFAQCVARWNTTDLTLQCVSCV